MPASTARLVLVLGALTALTPASVDMYLPSFPVLERALGAGAAAVQLTLGAFLVGLAVGQALYGPLADRLGRRRPLVAGLALFVLASAGCALATRIEALIALRFVQALGGSAALVIPRAVVRDRFDPQASARVFSLLVLVLGVAPILAPTVGGQILVRAGWRAIFAALAALGVAGLVLVIVALPETRPPSAAAATGAVRAALRDYARLLADRRFMGFAGSGGIAVAGMFAYISGSPFVLIELYQVPATAYGWVFGANAVGLIGASQLNRWLLGRYSAEALLGRALAASALVGVALLLASATGWGGLPALLVLLFGFLGSLGFVQPNALACALAGHPERAGSASALFGVVQFTVATGASALVGGLHDGTARPMATVMAACAGLALGVHGVLGHRRGRA
jgi:DHA1 family bicyclomycin/chloramphenicol resistance-like MFS transporter